MFEGFSTFGKPSAGFDENLSLSTVFQGNFLFRPTSGSEISRDVNFGASAGAKGFAIFSDTDRALLPGTINQFL